MILQCQIKIQVRMGAEEKVLTQQAQTISLIRLITAPLIKTMPISNLAGRLGVA